jgi:uracil-DNA glycosylase family 4
MSNDPFSHIRKLEQDFAKGELPAARTFEGDLLGGVANPYLEQLAQLSPVEFDQLADESQKRNVSLQRGDQLQWKLDESYDEQLTPYLDRLANCQQCQASGIKSCDGLIHNELSAATSKLEALFIGDAPKGGEDSDKSVTITGEGRKLLDKMIGAMNLAPSQFAITLSSKCSSRTDQDQKEMFLQCKQNLLSEIMLLRPKVVVTLGAMATNSLLGKEERLTNIHGKFLDGCIKLDNGNDAWLFKIIPIFHPNYLLINPNMKRTAWIDLQKIMAFLAD